MVRTVLVVDDNQINRQILRTILAADYAVLEAENGVKAMEILHRQHQTISAVLLDIVMPEMDGYQVLRTMHEESELSKLPVIVTTGSNLEEAEKRALALGANDFVFKPFDADIIKLRLSNLIRLRETAAMVNRLQRDELTGLLNRQAFFNRAAELIAKQEPGYYVMASFDVDNFKVINDQYGIPTGDKVLCRIADIFAKGFAPVAGLVCRVTADNFAVLYPSSFMESPDLAEVRRRAAQPIETMRPLSFSVGRYVVDDLTLSISGMYDRAVLAEMSVKGGYEKNIGLYDESMRKDLLNRQDIVSDMKTALESEQFEVWFQPQYNHANGALVGAEALVRWRHPQRGMISPGVFVPLFEHNGFIYELDKFVWEKTCDYLHKWLCKGWQPVPVSVNISRSDLLHDDIVEVLTALVRRYELPVDLLRLEITESAFVQSTDQIIIVVRELVNHGFTVEIDDFGSGYSSLNTLKDVPAQVLKLDMRFMEGGDNSDRGGSIIASVVRMSVWLGMAVIAEGVETTQRADYLSSIGCNYIQGFLYAKPVPAAEYEELLYRAVKENRLLTIETAEDMDNNAFWSPESMDTLLFNGYVGGACVFEYYQDNLEVLRVNEKYALELGGLTVEEALRLDLHRQMGDAEYQKLRGCIQQAAAEKRGASCEVYLAPWGNGHGGKHLYLTCRVIARTGERRLFYCTVNDTTALHTAQRKEQEVAGQMRAIMDNVSSGICAVNMVDGKMKVLLANPRFYAMFGLTAEEFSNDCQKGMEARLHPEDVARIMAIYQGTKTKEGIGGLEFRAVKKDGAVIWVRANTSHCRFPQVDTDVTIVSLDDISVEKQAELSAENASKRLAFLNSAAGELLTTHDVNSAIDAALHRVLDYFSADRAYIIEANEEKQTTSNTYEVCAAGIGSEMERLRDLPYDVSPFWFGSGEDYILIEDVSSLPEGRASERMLLMQQGIHSLIAATMRHADGVAGFIGVDNPARMGNADDLRVLGTYVLALLLRRDANAKLESESRAAWQLMNDTPGGFARMRLLPDGGLVTEYVNEPFCRLRRMRYEDIMSEDRTNAMNSVHPDDMQRLRAVIRDMMHTGKQSNIRYRLRRVDNTYTEVNVFARVTRDDKNNVIINAYYQEPDEAEKARIAQQELLPAEMTAMLENSEGIVYFKDAQLRYICANQRTATLLGCKDSKEIIGKTDAELFAADVAQENNSVEHRVMERGEPVFNCEIRLPSTNRAQAQYAKVSRYPLRDTQGRIIGVFGLGRDVTDERTAYAQLKLLTETTPGGLVSFILTATDVKLVYFNNGLCQMLGCTREQYAAHAERDMFSAVYEADKPTLLSQLDAMRADGSPVNCTYRIHRGGASGTRWLVLRAAVAGRQGDGRFVNAVIYDVTEQKRAERELGIRGKEYHQAIIQSGKLICRYTHCDGAVESPEDTAQLLGVPAHLDNVPMSVIEKGLIAAGSIEDYKNFYAAIRRGDKTGSATIQRYTAGGAWCWFDVRFSTVYDDDGEPYSSLVMLEDVTDRREEDAAETLDRQRFQAALATIYPLLISVNLTRDSYRVIAESGPISMLRAPTGTIGSMVESAAERMEKEFAKEFKRKFRPEQLMWTFAKVGDSLRLEYKGQGYDGETHWVEVVVLRTENAYDEDITGVVAVRFIDMQKMTEEKLRQADLDGMTNLFNKTATQESVTELLEKGKLRSCALLVADLDNLKLINDTHGHDVGDAAIRTMAELLRTQFRQTDIVGRIGGDEFLVFVCDISEERLRSSMTAFMRRLSATRIGEHGELPMHGSVGLVMSDGRDTYAELFKKADKALYHVKRSGKDNFAFYTPDMEREDYQHEVHIPESRWQSEHSTDELNDMLTLLAKAYPLVILANLTHDSYCILQYGTQAKQSAPAGSYDDLIADGLRTIPSEEHEAFSSAFSRENLLAAYAQGKSRVSLTVRQQGDDGIYRTVCTDVILTEKNGEIITLTLSRENKPTTEGSHGL